MTKEFDVVRDAPITPEQALAVLESWAGNLSITFSRERCGLVLDALENLKKEPVAWPEPMEHPPLYPDEDPAEQLRASRYRTGWNDCLEKCKALYTQPKHDPLKNSDLNICRQWFDSVHDVNPVYLTLEDFKIAEKLYQRTGIRVPESIKKITAAKPLVEQEHGEPSCPKCVFGVCHCKQDKVFVEGYGENSHSFVSITKQEPDYKALWEQMCERCDCLDKKLAIYSEQYPIGEAYLCNVCQTPFDGAYECPSCGHNTSTKTPIYIQPSDRSC